MGVGRIIYRVDLQEVDMQILVTYDLEELQ
jgi:hypothetical protein